LCCCIELKSAKLQTKIHRNLLCGNTFIRYKSWLRQIHPLNTPSRLIIGVTCGGYGGCVPPLIGRMTEKITVIFSQHILVPMCHYCLNCTKFGQLILRKIIKIFSTRCHILRLKCTTQRRNKVPIGYNRTPHIHPKTAPSLRRSPPKSNTPIPSRPLSPPQTAS